LRTRLLRVRLAHFGHDAADIAKPVSKGVAQPWASLIRHACLLVTVGKLTLPAPWLRSPRNGMQPALVVLGCSKS
jgi:hypothetical protein